MLPGRQQLALLADGEEDQRLRRLAVRKRADRLRTLEGDKTAKARRVGALVAERATTAGVQGVVFDRAGNKYHGRVAALADGAREGGLTF